MVGVSQEKPKRVAYLRVQRRQFMRSMPTCKAYSRREVGVVRADERRIRKVQLHHRNGSVARGAGVSSGRHSRDLAESNQLTARRARSDR